MAPVGIAAAFGHYPVASLQGESDLTMPTLKITNTMIEAAISGFEAQKSQIDTQIAELRAMLTGSTVITESESPTSPRKRSKLSAASRKRMAEAQKQRWAKIKGEPATVPVAAVEPKAAEPKTKRKLSEAGRQNIINALKRRNAAKRTEAEGTSQPTAKKAAKAKRKLSAEGRQRIIEATKRMWSAKRAAAETAGKPAAKKGAR